MKINEINPLHAVRGYSPEVIHVLPFAFWAARLTPAMPLELSKRRTRGAKPLVASRQAWPQPLLACRSTRAESYSRLVSCTASQVVVGVALNLAHLFVCLAVGAKFGGALAAKVFLLARSQTVNCGVSFCRLFRRKAVPNMGRNGFRPLPCKAVVKTDSAVTVAGEFFIRILHIISFFLVVAASLFCSHCLALACNLKLHKSTTIFNFFSHAKPQQNCCFGRLLVVTPR